MKLHDLGLNHGQMEILKDVDTHTRLRCHCGRTFAFPKNKGTGDKDNYVIVDGVRRGRCPQCGCVHNGLNNEGDLNDDNIRANSEKPSKVAKEKFAKAKLKFFMLMLKAEDMEAQEGIAAAKFTMAAIGPAMNIDEFALRILQEHAKELRKGFAIEEIDEAAFDKLTAEIEQANGSFKASMFGALLSQFLDRRTS